MGFQSFSRFLENRLDGFAFFNTLVDSVFDENLREGLFVEKLLLLLAFDFKFLRQIFLQFLDISGENFRDGHFDWHVVLNNAQNGVYGDFAVGVGV